MNYRQAIEFLEARERLGIRLGTANMARLLARLDNPHRHLKCLHVAGTNGKGSTARLLSGILAAAGRRVGLYISPHLFETRERIQVDNKPVSEGEFARLITRLAPLVLEQSSFPPHSLTYFETMTAAAFECFRARKVDYAVIETGMGGRHDATNVVDPLVSVITPIGKEHRRFLGNTLGAIAGEKAGIIKPGRPVVSAPQRPVVLEVLRRAAREAGAPFFLVGRDVRREPAGPGGAPGEFSLRFVAPDRKGETRVPGLRVALAGGYQVENAALACLALRAAEIQVPAARVRRALATVAWPGRLQVIARDPTIIFDVSHNPPALAILLDNLRELYPDRKPCFVFGVLSDKDYRLMIRYLGQAGHAFTFTRPDSPRARDPRVLAAYFHRIYPGRLCREEPDPVEAVRSAAAALEPGGLLCVCGSFYLAPILRLFPGASATGVPGS